MRFCPQCGTKTVSKAQFCTDCGAPLAGDGGKKGQAGKKASPAQLARLALPAHNWKSLIPGLVVLSVYLTVGIGIWIFVLQSQPFPVVAANGPASQGGSQQLPQNHPPVTIPEDVTQRIRALVDEANANPQAVETWRQLAEVQFRASQVDASYRSAALSSYQHILEIAPQDPDALRGIGNVYYDFEEYPKAIDYYQQYLSIQPNDQNVRTDLGTMYLYMRELDQAIAEYQAVIDKDPAFFQANFNLGIAYREKGDLEKARETLVHARTLTDDKRIHTRVDQVLAQFGSPTSVQQGTASAAPPQTPFQSAVDKLLHAHEIMGPKIARIEWPRPADAQVYLKNFPMSGMPQDVRDRFLAKLRIQVGVAKKTNNIEENVTVEFIDADTQSVMETLQTETS